MIDLMKQLRRLHGRVCIMGIGNVGGGDDGFGVLLAQELSETGVHDVVIARTSPELFVSSGSSQRFDHVLFLDAVDFGGEPGSVVFLSSKEMIARFPQVSTHRLSLGLLAKWAESNGVTKAWLLGVQPKSLGHEHHLTAEVKRSYGALRELLIRQFAVGVHA